MNGISYAIGRLTRAGGLLLAVLVLNFTLIHAAPGDPAQVIAGEMGGATQEMITEIRSAYGLDRPLPYQIVAYLGRVAQGDLGYSFYYNQPVLSLILQRLGPTILLVVSSLVLAVIIGTMLGAISAQKPNGALSHTVTVLSLIGYAAPVFWVGIMLIILFSIVFPVFPVSGMSTPGSDAAGIGRVLDIAQHLVLPATTLALIYLAFYSRLSRASMLDVLRADYIRTARAKGLSRVKVIYKHALRNAAMPIVTYAGLQFAHVISGAVLVETVFAWPGLGTLAFDSILRRDTPMLLGILFFSALLVVLVNLLTDLAYRLIDPRVR